MTDQEWWRCCVNGVSEYRNHEGWRIEKTPSAWLIFSPLGELVAPFGDNKAKWVPSLQYAKFVVDQLTKSS